MAQQSLESNQNIHPNLFNLSGDSVQVIYTSSGINGQPSFNFQGFERHLRFTGDEICTQDIKLGTLVTVPLIRTIDTGYTSLTLFVPNVNLSGETAQLIKTVAIESVHPGSIPLVQTYKVYKLWGQAQFVFL